jgi:serine/threonine-protein phosphatase Stp1
MTGSSLKENQDSFLNFPDKFLWAVADGVGGGVAGAYASRLVIQKIAEIPLFLDQRERITAIRKVVSEVNTILRNYKNESSLPATTVTILLVLNSEATCLWAGDSRLYLLRQDVLYQTTKDHTLRQDHIDKGLLTVPEALRMVKGNIITRAVGGEEEVDLEEITFDLEPKDRLLLCTDGLSKILSSQNLAEILRKGKSPQSISQMFFDKIQDLPQPDNITQITLIVSDILN